MNFTQYWFSKDIPSFEKYFAEFKNKLNIKHLEIGAFEGRSVIWLLENILTPETAIAILVDPMQACFGEHEEIDFTMVKVEKISLIQFFIYEWN